jgi:hypothetical protein
MALTSVLEVAILMGTILGNSLLSAFICTTCAKLAPTIISHNLSPSFGTEWTGINGKEYGYHQKAPRSRAS